MFFHTLRWSFALELGALRTAKRCPQRVNPLPTKWSHGAKGRQCFSTPSDGAFAWSLMRFGRCATVLKGLNKQHYPPVVPRPHVSLEPRQGARQGAPPGTKGFPRHRITTTTGPVAACRPKQKRDLHAAKTRWNTRSPKKRQAPSLGDGLLLWWMDGSQGVRDSR